MPRNTSLFYNYSVYKEKLFAAILIIIYRPSDTSLCYDFAGPKYNVPRYGV